MILEALLKAASFTAPECKVCGGPIAAQNRIGICQNTSACKAAARAVHRARAEARSGPPRPIATRHSDRSCEVCGGTLGASNKSGFCRRTSACNSARRGSATRRPRTARKPLEWLAPLALLDTLADEASAALSAEDEAYTEAARLAERGLDFWPHGPDVDLANKLMEFFENGGEIKDLPHLQNHDEQDQWQVVRDGTEGWA